MLPKATIVDATQLCRYLTRREKEYNIYNGQAKSSYTNLL